MKIKKWDPNANSGNGDWVQEYPEVDIDNIIATGTPSSTTFLRGDGQWATPSDTTTLSGLGITATAAELNKLDGVTATTTEINYIDGVTSSIQTQLDGKAASSHTHTKSDITDFSHTHAISDVTNLQTSLNAKAPLASPALTGTPTAPTASSATNNTQIATTAYVNNKLAGVSGGMNFAGAISLSGGKNGDDLATAGLTSPGDYLIVTTAGTITSGGTLVTLAVQAPGDEGDSTLPVTLEVGDWIVYVSGDGSTMTVSIINNTDTRFAALTHNHSATEIVTGELNTARMGTGTATSGYVLKSDGDGTASWQSDNNTTYTLGSFGITATAAEINKLDGVTATTAEINYVDGVTSNIQTQLDGKAASSHTHSYLPLSGGTLTGTLTSRAISMQNYDITGINALSFNDPGVNEGISWNGGNFSIYESPDNLTNAAGNLQFVSGGTRRLSVKTDGTVEVPSGNLNVNGNILLTGDVTTTNQGRLIDFTGFDKEGTTDFSDRAYIQHTTNTGGHSGSVLVISSQNDSNDGIAFSTNASSLLKHNSNNIFTDGYHPNADKWTTSRTLSLSGDASGSVSWDGSANATLSVTVNDDSHNHTIANVDGLQTALDGKQAAGTYDNYSSWTFRALNSAGTSLGSSAITSGDIANIKAGSNVTLSWADDTVTISSTDTNTVYTHPTHPGDDINIDTGALTGATIISDLDFNITTDTLGHVTDANGTVATRTLTLGDLGYTGATNANYITNNNQLTNGAGYITGNQTISLTGDASGSGTTSISVTVNDNSHKHNPSTLQIPGLWAFRYNTTTTMSDPGNGYFRLNSTTQSSATQAVMDDVDYYGLPFDVAGAELLDGAIISLYAVDSIGSNWDGDELIRYYVTSSSDQSGYTLLNIKLIEASADAIDSLDVVYVRITPAPKATSTIPGGLTARLSGTTLYLRNDGANA